MLNDSSHSIAGRIRALRSRQGRTLQEIADACGITRSMLSKVETSKANPTAALLGRLARALGVPMSALLEEGARKTTVYRPADANAPLTITDKGYRFLAFAAERPGKAMQPFLFRVGRGQIKRKPMSHPGEEFVYMLRGEMKYRVGPAEYRLRPGDSLYFDAEQDHDLEPISAEVEYLAVFCEASPPAPATRRKAMRKVRSV